MAAVLTALAPAASGAPRRPPHLIDSSHLNYAASGTFESLVSADDAAFETFATPVRDDLNWILDAHNITDRTNLRTLLGVRLAFETMSGHEDQAALFTLAQVRNLEDKPAARLLAGVEIEALLKARLQAGVEDGPQVVHAYARILRADLRALPWAEVGDNLIRAKSQSELASKALIVGELAPRIDPSLAQTHSLSASQAWMVVNARMAIRMLPLKDETLAALTEVVGAHGVSADEIWPGREVTLTAADKLTPVTVAIWDSGTDLSLFPGQVYTDPSPAPDADPHGIAFDVHGLPTHGELYPIDPVHLARYPQMVDELKGFSELQSGVAGPDSDALKRKLAGLTTAQVGDEMQTLSLYEAYVHGTHVAGIAARGNPAVRLAVARMTLDWRTVPEAPTEALAAREVEDFKAYVRWFRDHHVRVVNMSWEGTEGGVVAGLDANAVGKTMQSRLLLGRRIFHLEADGLRAALAGAPDILFVCAAGNSGEDTSSSKGIPSAFVLPNLLSVGAVDAAGRETGFTNYGDAVKVDADGAQVESLLPGGFRVRFSGTSMAAPNVVNLAAKLLALDPDLTPPQVIKLIVDGATPSPDGRLHTINPQRSVELLRGMKQASAR
jgi:subtilisin family serine protease